MIIVNKNHIFLFDVDVIVFGEKKCKKLAKGYEKYEVVGMRYIMNQ